MSNYCHLCLKKKLWVGKKRRGGGGSKIVILSPSTSTQPILSLNAGTLRLNKRKQRTNKQTNKTNSRSSEKFKPPLLLIFRLTGWRIPRYIRINSFGILVEGYVNIFLWNSREVLNCEVVAGAFTLTVICVLKNRRGPL